MSEHDGWRDLSDRELLAQVIGPLGEAERTLPHSSVLWAELATMAGHVRRRLDAPVPDSLDAAWAEAEAALPEGWRIDRLGFAFPGGPFPGGRWRPEEGVWRVLSSYIDDDSYEEGEEAEGPTPAAALRALAAKLREA